MLIMCKEELNKFCTVLFDICSLMIIHCGFKRVAVFTVVVQYKKLCNKNQQMYTFYIKCFDLIIVSSTCFEHPSVHPQEDPAFDLTAYLDA